MDQNYNWKNIRTLLTEGFTAEELRRFCFDEGNFRAVYNKLTQDTGKDKIIDLLLDYANQKLQTEILLIWAKEHNPIRYEKYQPYYDITINPTISTDVNRKPQKTVFISYGHEDVEAARRLYQELKAEKGIEPWFDKENLLPGMKWEPAIRKAIREADFFIVLLSKNSTSRKGYINSELHTALEILKQFPDDQIYLIPIRLDECEIHIEDLRDIQHVDFFPDWKKGLERIRVVIKSRIPIEKPEGEKMETNSSGLGYHYRVGIVDLDIGLTNLFQLAQRLNTIQNYFHFTCPTLPSITNAVREIEGQRNLDVHQVPDNFYEEHQYLSVDLIACLTKYPLAFRENGKLLSNYFSGPGEKDDRFMFISTHLLYELIRLAGCTFEKGIIYIIISQLVVYFTDWGYHDATLGCVMDFCENRWDMVEGLKSMRFCDGCKVMIQNPDLEKALNRMLLDDMRL
ncbi:MAG: toll/interleukin-1 receptor domain-containing protein [Anaerolineales bacterium]|nr:toll/interleukin-1 receptor domain-containing protein [Anaerolineales bacterium]